MSKIEWTFSTWNPTTGCTKISPGCKHCYAERMAKRLQAMGQEKYADGFAVRCHEDVLREPFHLRKPQVIFVNSMNDLFHEDIPYEYVKRVFEVMIQCNRHVYQVLTKRAERLEELVPQIYQDVLSDPRPGMDGLRDSAIPDSKQSGHTSSSRDSGVPDSKQSGQTDPDTVPPHIWLGVSVENRDYTWRIEHLRRTPAAIRFLSIEPLLGPIDNLNLTDIHWVIVGGESGPQARVIQPDWVRSIRDQCHEQNVPFFFKQWGGLNKKKAGRLLDGKPYMEMPELPLTPNGETISLML